MIPVSKEVLNEEIGLAQRILKKWENLIAKGVPGQDFPAEEAAMDSYVREFVAELLVVSGKLETLANIINADQG